MYRLAVPMRVPPLTVSAGESSMTATTKQVVHTTPARSTGRKHLTSVDITCPATISFALR
jgi:hypothetical protein